MSVEGIKIPSNNKKLNEIKLEVNERIKGQEFSNKVDNVNTITEIYDLVDSAVTDAKEVIKELSIPEETRFVQEDKRVEASKSNTINKAIAFGIKTADNKNAGYSNETRWGNPNYDCSSLIISAFENAGIPVKEHGANCTSNMRNAFLETGQFEWIPGAQPIESLKPGDIILNESQHVEMYVGKGNNLGAHDDNDGVDGDSSGKEIDIAPYNFYCYIDGILRYTGKD